MNTPAKSLIIVIDKRTLQEYIYKEVRNFELIYANSQVVEFVVTDRDYARHHFPKEYYNYELYQEQLMRIDSFDFNEIRQEYEETIGRIIEPDGPLDRAKVEGRI